MAGAWRSWALLLVTTVLLTGAARVVYAQSAATQPETGSLDGKLTDLHSAPLSGVEVVVRNEATGAEMRTMTARNGGYRFTGLAAGIYTLTAESGQLGRGEVGGIEIDAGQEARVQAAMEFEPLPPQPVQMASRPMEKATPVSARLAAEPEQALPLRGQPAEIPETVKATAPMPAAEIHPAAALVAVAKSASEPEPKPDAGAPRNIVKLTEKTRPESAAGHPETSLKALPAANLSARLMVNPAIGQHPAMATATGSAELRVGGAAGAGPSSLGLPGAAISEAAIRTARSAIVLSRSPALRTQAIAEQAGQADETDPASQAATTTMSSAELQALPSSGRHWQDFLLDAPTATARQGGLGEIALRGAGQEQADTTLDGTSTTLAFGTEGSREQSNGGEGLSERSGLEETQGGGRGFAVPEAAIREVRTEAGNVEAEGERAAGGRMDVETESGSNGLHGQGFLFGRSNAWGAQNPFTQLQQFTGFASASPSYPAYTPPDDEISGGIGMGSVLRRNKLFWFAALDGSQRNDPAVAMVRHPYLAAVTPPQCTPGDKNNPCSAAKGFFAQPTNDQMQVLSARLGLSSANSVAEGLAAHSSMLQTLAGLLGPAPRTSAQWVGFARIDWQAAERHRLVLEASGADWNAPGGGMARVSENYGSHSFGNRAASQAWLMGRWEAYLTPNLLAVTQGSVGRAIASTHASTPSAFEQTFLTGSPLGQLPQIGVDSRYGFTIGTPAWFGSGSYPYERIYQAQETLSWVHGRTLVNTGFQVSHNADMTSLLRNQAGTFSYASVENFASDALVFAKYGLSGVLNPASPYGCDQTGKVWRDSAGNLRGLGDLPCYAYYSQTMGPSGWHLSTNDWAGFVNAQWRAGKQAVFSAGLRWDREQLPPPIAALNNTQLPQTEKLPSLGNNWGPRFSLALGNNQDRRLGWPVLRLGYGLYYGRTENATIETVITQTGSANGDRHYFIRPMDGYNSFTGKSDAPLFPDVLSGTPASEIKPAAVEFAPNFRNPEVHQAVVSLEEELPGRMNVTASGMVSLGRRLPVTLDTNLTPLTPTQTITYAVVDGTGAGPIKAPQITVPFYASWPASSATCPSYTPTSAATPGRLCPDYQQIAQIMSGANSTYEALMLRVIRSGRRGLNLMVYYTYAHAMDWNPNESTLVAGSDVLDPANLKLEYGTSDLDVRHSATAYVIYQAPWKLHDMAGKLANGWIVSAIGRFHTGFPYTMRTSGSLAREFDQTGAAIVGLGPGMNGSGGDNRIYGLGSDNKFYNIGRNTFRYPPVWKADLRLGRRFNLGEMRRLELLAESFNLFNHENVTRIETTGYYIQSGDSSGSLPTLNFLNGVRANSSAFGQPLNVNATNFYRERQFQFGMQFTF
jgi:Carboxypeptidase regulatory-like domain